MDKSLEIGALAAALAKAQGQMGTAKKDATNPQFRSKYADFAAVVDAIRKPLADNELSYSQIAGTTPEGLIVIETILMHSSGEWLAGTLAMQPTAIRQGGAVLSIPPGEMTPHVVGSVITYARRYGLQAIVGLPADDDDGNAASGNTASPRQAAARPESPQTASRSAKVDTDTGEIWDAPAPQAPKPEPEQSPVDAWVQQFTGWAMKATIRPVSPEERGQILTEATEVLTALSLAQPQQHAVWRALFKATGQKAQGKLSDSLPTNLIVAVRDADEAAMTMLKRLGEGTI